MGLGGLQKRASVGGPASLRIVFVTKADGVCRKQMVCVTVSNSLAALAGLLAKDEGQMVCVTLALCITLALCTRKSTKNAKTECRGKPG